MSSDAYDRTSLKPCHSYSDCFYLKRLESLDLSSVITLTSLPHQYSLGKLKFHNNKSNIWTWKKPKPWRVYKSLQWRHNKFEGVSNQHVSTVCSAACSGTDQRKYLSPASLTFVRGIHRWPMDSPRKRPVTRKCFHLMTSSSVLKYEYPTLL